MNNLAIITARGGSKRIPRKNIKQFLGKPIIAYSIEAAIEANIYKEIMVSTDDAEIASIAQMYGASVPFFRSKEMSDDFAITADVISEVLNEYRRIGQQFDVVSCIYPTAPFVTSSKLLEAYYLLEKSGADSVIPITKFSFPIWRSFGAKDGKLFFNWPENANKRSQDLPPAFHDCGQFYFLRVEEFIKSKKLITNNTLGLEVPESEVQDIDNEEDWKIAEIKYSFIQKK